LCFPLPIVLLPPLGFARGCRGGGLGSIITCDDDELALVDATGDGRSAETGSNGATDDAGDDEVISGEGFLRFFDVGTTEVAKATGEARVGAGEAAETGESASGD